jgi:uncharacterized protein
MSTPTTPTERIESIDVLRGFALLGILLINMQSFAMPVAAYLNPTAYGDLTGANFWAWALSHVFADMKFISIFSMLFGAGIVLMAERAEKRAASAAPLHYRRMGWMVLFGILHAHLLWYGDILYSYGMAGLVVYLFRRLRPRALVTVGVLLGTIPSLLFLVIGLSIPYWPAEAAQGFTSEWQPNAQTTQEELDAYRGSYIDQLLYRAPESLGGQLGVFPLFLSWRVSSLMLLGMALFKVGALRAQWSSRKYMLLVASGVFIGIPIIVVGIYWNFAQNWNINSLFLGIQFNYWGSYLVALGWVGTIMLWCRSALFPALKARAAALGRTAFSNYILQTLICTTIFYGHGLGYFGSVDRIHQVLLTFVIYTVQLAISPVWLRHFQFGPLEWVWRRLTYGRPQGPPIIHVS